MERIRWVGGVGDGCGDLILKQISIAIPRTICIGPNSPFHTVSESRGDCLNVTDGQTDLQNYDNLVSTTGFQLTWTFTEIVDSSSLQGET